MLPREALFFHFTVDCFLELRWPILTELLVLKIYSFPLTLSVPNSDDICRLLFYFNKLSLGKTFKCKVDRLNVKQRRSLSSGSMLFSKAYYYRLWHWKSLKDQGQLIFVRMCMVFPNSHFGSFYPQNLLLARVLGDANMINPKLILFMALYINIQSTLVISNSLISNYRLSRSEKLVPA